MKILLEALQYTRQFCTWMSLNMLAERDGSALFPDEADLVSKTLLMKFVKCHSSWPGGLDVRLSWSAIRPNEYGLSALK